LLQQKYQEVWGCWSWGGFVSSDNQLVGFTCLLADYKRLDLGHVSVWRMKTC